MSPAALLAATAALLAADLSPEERAEAIAKLYQGTTEAVVKRSRVRDPNSPEAVKKRRQRSAKAGDSGGTEQGTERDTSGAKAAPGRPETEVAPILGLGEEETQKRKQRDNSLSQPGPSELLFAPATLAPTEPDPIDAIWSAYLTARSARLGATGGIAPVLTPKRRALIVARMKDHPVEQLTAAVTNVWASDFHVTGGYTGIDLVLRDAEKVERFAALAVAPIDPDAWTPQEREEHAAWAKTHPPVPLTFPLAREPDLSVPNVVDDDMRALAAASGRNVHELCADLERHRLAKLGGAK